MFVIERLDYSLNLEYVVDKELCFKDNYGIFS